MFRAIAAIQALNGAAGAARRSAAQSSFIARASTPDLRSASSQRPENNACNSRSSNSHTP